MAYDTDVDEVELGFWRTVLRRRVVLIVAIVAVFVCAVLGTLLVRPPSATATAEVYVGPTDPRAEGAFLQSNVVRTEAAAELGYEPSIDVSGSEGSPIIEVTASDATPQAAVAQLSTYLDTYVRLRGEAAELERDNASDELSRSLTEIYELLTLPNLRPELRAILERERLAYEEAVGAVLAESVLIPAARPSVLAPPVASGAGAPDLAVYGAGSTVIGFVVALAVAGVVERLDPRVGRSGAAATALGAGLLGTVPGAPQPPRPLRLLQRLRGRPPRPLPLAVPGSGAADAFSLLRARLRASDEDKLRTVQIVAAEQRDFVHSARLALDLARSCARVGTRTALVVADYRSDVTFLDALALPPADPQAPEQEQGLAGVLAGTAPLHAALCTPLPTPHLQVLVPGPPPMNVVDDLGGSAFGLVITELGLSADVVLILTPPLLAHPDGLVVGEAVDATLVVASRRSRRRELDRARSQLDAVDARVAGVVFAGTELI